MSSISIVVFLSSNCGDAILNGNTFLYPSEPTPEPTPSLAAKHLMLCPKPGYFCTSALPLPERCCNGGVSGTTRCDFTEIDNNGYQIGTCCVKGSQTGCVFDTDCCKSNHICNDLVCTEFANSAYSLQSFDIRKVNNVDLVHDIEPGNTILRIDVLIIAVLCLLFAIVSIFLLS
eukprot:UN11515